MRRRPEPGTVTAEIAIVLPVVVLVLAAGAGTVQSLMAQIRCVDAARAGARLAARGEPGPVSVAEARRVGPRDSMVDVSESGQAVTVRVSAVVRFPLGVDVPVGSTFTALRELP